MQKAQNGEVVEFLTVVAEVVEMTMEINVNKKLEEGMVLQYAQDGNYELRIFLQELVGRILKITYARMLKSLMQMHTRKREVLLLYVLPHMTTLRISCEKWIMLN